MVRRLAELAIYPDHELQLRHSTNRALPLIVSIKFNIHGIAEG